MDTDIGPIGLHAAMLERRYPLPEALTRAAALGAQSYEIDLGIGAPGEPWAARAETFRGLLPELRSAAQSEGLALPSLCLGTLWQTSLASPDEAERAVGVQVVEDACAFAEALGATALLLPVGQPPGVAPEAARANLVGSLRACGESARAAGVVLALENVCQAVLLGAEALLEVVSALDTPHCGVYCDLGNPSFVGRDPVLELRTLAPHLARVHAKDTVNVRRARPPLPETPITGDFSVWQRHTTVTLGTGEVALAACAQVLREVGYTAGVIVEVPQPPERAEAGCLENLAAARRLFGA